MQGEAGETERLRLYSFKAGLEPPSSDLSKGKQFSGDGVAGSMNGAAIQP
jgi:hypothetical protein